MKKITFLIFGLCYCLTAISQQIPSSEVVIASMPPGSRLLTEDQVTKFTSEHFKRSQIPAGKKNIYQLDELIISFWDLSVNPEFKKSLKDSQSEISEYLGRDDANTINYTKLIRVNDIQFLIYQYERHGDVYLRFQSEYNKNNRDICGVIQFSKPNEAKAQEALQTFLKTVHFKE
jgi:hypothetical protein